MTGAVEMDAAGEELELLPDHAVFWRRGSTLMVADPHFGKAATFRAAGIFVPEETTAMTLTRLDELLIATGAERIIFLGDFLHAREGRAPSTLDAIEEWRAAHPWIAMTLVRGNHDVRAGDPPDSLRIECVDGPLIDGPFALAHHPSIVKGAYVLAGHVHPGARLYGAGRERVRVPCFWFGRDYAILPAFGEFTGLADIKANPGDRVWVTTGEEVIAIASVSVPQRSPN
ncbi:MAG: ligase-associated DNA damage response endonuclease PdeM [Gemmatimonadaceae bacterium]|nr:ligase-associated DNA damage response endonuclease PdeM [Gemmatimonadaceae bacterium]